MAKDRLGIIGGTGLYALDELEQIEKRELATPFGSPSAPILIGKMGRQEVCFLPRHGENHQYLPSEVNYRANLWALKEMGVRGVVSVSATGSLVEEIAPGELSLVSQYFDWTRGKRDGTFFGKGLVAHVSTAKPACDVLSAQLVRAARDASVKLHTGKTYACVEGPRLGTRAESFFLKKADCHLIGMTNLPEAFLALEAQLCYCTIAVVTDFDCWLDDPDKHASVDTVLSRYKESISDVQNLLRALLTQGVSFEGAEARQALASALVTPLDALSSGNKKIWSFLKT